MMNMNPMMIMNMLKGSNNPQQVVMNLMKQNMGNNPVMNNAFSLLEKGDNAGLEQLARNLCKQKNINPDEAIAQISNQFGMMK